MSVDITILVPDIGANTVGAAVRLAQQLDRRFAVEIVGPDFGSGVCSMYRDAYRYEVVPCPHLYRYPDYWWERERLAARLRGTMILAMKAYMDTVPLALRERRRRGARVAVYLDEWDAAVLRRRPPLRRFVHRITHFHRPMSEAYHARVERMIPAADLVLVTTRSLQRRFGGHVLRAGVDAARFLPQPPAEVAALRAELGLQGRRLIVFGGVVRPHKGVDLILEALCRLDRPDVALLVAGPVTDHLSDLLRNPRYRPRLAVAGAAPAEDPGRNATVHERMALHLDLAEFIVLPLSDDPLARSQMPIKVFEALAMGKMIIGARVADLPEILEGCGVLYTPDDAGDLARHIARALDDPERTAAFGRASREKALREFAFEITRNRLESLVEPLLRRPLTT